MASRKDVNQALRAHKSALKLTDGNKSLWQGLFPNHTPQPLNWDDRRLREIAADRVLRIERSDAALGRAFREFDLDPANPFDWRYLLTVFAEAHYQKDKKRGPKLKWDSKRWIILLADFYEVKNKKPALKDLSVCKAIIKRFPDRYERMIGSTLRRQLLNARDVNQNTILREMRDTCRKRIETELLNRGENYEDSRLTKAAYNMALTLVSKREFLRGISSA